MHIIDVSTISSAVSAINATRNLLLCMMLMSSMEQQQTALLGINFSVTPTQDNRLLDHMAIYLFYTDKQQQFQHSFMSHPTSETVKKA